MGIDEIFMKKAIRLARKGLGATSPNPMVGAVVVKNGRIVGSGYHKKAGAPHAEVEALSEAGGDARGGTLYVNLEPCNHYGRTPPCTKTVVERGIEKVVIGMLDPNPHVVGGGCGFLEANGIKVKYGILEEECAQLNEIYTKYITKGRPFVVVKGALTLDGWMAPRSGKSKWITNEKSRRYVHSLRHRMDGVMVGVETVISDNPLLAPYLLKKAHSDPVKIIADTHLRIPLNSRVLDQATSALTIIASGSNVSDAKLKEIEGPGARVIKCRIKDKHVDLDDLLCKLAEMSVSSLLVEGGATLFGSLIRERMVDKFYIFLAPKILGGDDGVPFMRGAGCHILDDCLGLRVSRLRRFDDDIMIEAYPRG
jgi:diaminohydroxyphosphoribosylaminopyrimidine deaminase/5-amino-6-(5-phosphoribosylamino)uracil reductase